MTDSNLYRRDPAFARRMARLLGDDLPWAEKHLEAMGAIAGGEADALGSEADREDPRLQQYDAHGERIDEIRFHPSYERLRELSYGNGIVGLAYDENARPGGGRAPQALVLGMAYLFAQAEAGLTCPICMTNGAARVIERFGDPALRDRFVPRLAATERDRLFEGAMWLTEKQGGSDVGANETVAKKKGDRWVLDGSKWFTSNAGAEVMLVLARPEGAPPGTAGLSLFLVPLHKDDGSRNGIRFDRLKDKLGTRSMPTAESRLEGAEGFLLASPPAGFKAMAEMINLSRLYNATASCAAMRRGLHEAIAWADERRAFGKLLRDHPLMREVLADMATEIEASTALTFESIRLLDRLDAGAASDDEKVLVRVFTSLAKLYTAKQAVAVTSEAVECLGGNGYVETFVTPRLLRDAQVLPIWEGTTNILSLDVLVRGFGKARAQQALTRWAETQLGSIGHKELAAPATLTEETITAIARLAEAESSRPDGPREAIARDVAFRAAQAIQAVLLIVEADAAIEQGDARGCLLARRHVARRLAPLPASGVPNLPELDDAGFDALVRGTPLPVAAAARV